MILFPYIPPPIVPFIVRGGGSSAAPHETALFVTFLISMLLLISASIGGILFDKERWFTWNMVGSLIGIGGILCYLMYETIFH